MLRLLLSVLTLFVLVSQTACVGSKSPPVFEGSAPVHSATPQSLWNSQGSHEENLPFSLHITEELYDGKRLYIQGRLESATPWDMRELAIRLITLKQGEVLGVSLYPLDEIVVNKPASEEGTMNFSDRNPAEFLVWGDAEAMSDYQLEVLWGEEALKSPDNGARVSRDVQATQSRLEIRNIQVETERMACEQEEVCKANFRISGELFNTGSAIVSFVNLAIGLPSDQELVETAQSSVRTTEDEEMVEITNLGLRPGNSRELRLTMEREIFDPGMLNRIPYLRIISFGGVDSE